MHHFKLICCMWCKRRQHFWLFCFLFEWDFCHMLLLIWRRRNRTWMNCGIFCLRENIYSRNIDVECWLKLKTPWYAGTSSTPVSRSKLRTSSQQADNQLNGGCSCRNMQWRSRTGSCAPCGRAGPSVASERFHSAGVCVGRQHIGKWRTVSAQPSHSHFPNTRYPTLLTKTGAPVRFLFSHCCTPARVSAHLFVRVRACVSKSFLPICLCRHFLSANTAESGTTQLDIFALAHIHSVPVYLARPPRASLPASRSGEGVHRDGVGFAECQNGGKGAEWISMR